MTLISTRRPSVLSQKADTDPEQMKKENYKLSSHIDMHIMLAAHLDLGLFNLRVNAC